MAEITALVVIRLGGKYHAGKYLASDNPNKLMGFHAEKVFFFGDEKAGDNNKLFDIASHIAAKSDSPLQHFH